MLLRISRILAPIVNDPSVKLIVIYRIDGTPILTQANEKSGRILSILYWLEEQIKVSLSHMFIKGLDEVSFTHSDINIKMYAISKTLVLTIILDSLSLLHQYRLEGDIENVRDNLREMFQWKLG